MKNKNALPSSALLRRALFCSALVALFGFSPDEARAQSTNINASTNFSAGETDIAGLVTIIGNGVPNVTLTVQNPGTVLNLGAARDFSLYTGYNVAGSGSRVVVTNGGRINASQAVYTGYGWGGVSNNQLIVTGEGSAFVGSGGLILSRQGFGNSILISNGGLLSGRSVSVGGNPVDAEDGPYSPKMEVTGPGSVLRSTEWFQVGRRSAAQLTLGNGGTIEVGGLMSVSGKDPLGSGMLIGNGTVNAGGGLAFTNTGRLAPSGTAALTVNGNLSFNSGFFDWNLFTNSTDNPGTDFTRPIVLNGDISGVTSSRLVVNLTNSAGSGAFWDTSRAWDLITTTSGNLGLGTRLGLSFTGNTNSISLTNFSLLSTNNALRLVYNAPPPVPTDFYWKTNAIGIWAAGTNWSANLVPGATNKAFINSGGTATVSAAATVNSVVIGSTNGSTGGTLTLSNGALTAPGGVSVASASGSTGVLNFNGGSLAAPTIAFGSGAGSVNFNQTDALSVTSVISGNGTVRQLGTGVTTLGGVNTYVGATVVSNGTLAVTGKLANNAGSSVTVNTGGTLSFGAADVFGPINASLIRTPLTINGGLVQNSGAFQNILGKVTLSNGGILRSTGVGERGIAFSFSGDERNPLAFTVYGGPGNSRIEGPGIALGNDRLAHTWFDITNDSTMTVAGNLVNGIYGAGQLIKYGAGTLVLTGTNAYTGPTTIWQGTVQVGDGGTSGNLGAGNVEVGGPLVFNRSDNITVPNSMSSWNTVTQIGTGTVTLSGRSSYTGGTVVSNGTIAVTGKLALANNAGNTVTVNSNASFVFANNDVFDFHFANVLTPIVINGGGTVRNSGRFYNALGPITMNGGTLAALDTIFGYSFSLKGAVTVNSDSTISGPGISLGAAAVTGTTFNVTNNATLTVVDGLINGPSATFSVPQPSFLTKTGAGTMLLNGTNTYTGTTTISAGTLSLGGAGVLGGGNYGGNIANNGTFIVGTTANQILGGVMSGSGALVKNAAGTLTLDGVNTYTNTTTINAGTLLLNGEHTGGAGYTVNSGGTLGGLGSTTSLVTVAAGGDITPGAGGTEELVIGGLDLQGRLNVYLDGDSSSLLSVLGGATLGGTSSVSFSQGPNALTAPIYVFLAATNGISGTFGSTNGVPTGYGVFYDVNDGIAFLKNNAASNVATALFEGENAVIGNGSTNFNVYAFNGGTASATFTATAGALTTGGPLSTNITASNGVELSSLTFTGSGTNFGTNTGTFQADFNGQTNTIEYDVVVYDHAKGSLAANVVSLGSAIVGFSNPITGSLQVNASNSAAGFNAPLGADVTNSPTNTLTFTAARDIEGGTSGNLLVNLGTNQGSGVFSNNVTVTFFDDSTLSGATTLATSTNTASFAVTATIYDHASNQLSGTDLFLRPVHQGFRGTLVSTNSISVTNAPGIFRVALGSENTYSNDLGLTVGTVSGLAAGATADIDATYDLTEAIAEIGRSTNTVEARFFDDSDLLGANNNLQTVNIQVIGYVYTGQGVWTGNGTDWSAITNWQVPGGTPGLDGALSVNDTATFDTTGTSYDVDLVEDASLRSITFSNAANAYTIGGAGGISLTAASDGSATLANLDGAHTISNSIRMGSALQVTNAAGSQLTLAGVLSGFNGLTKSGEGTLTFAGANTYSGRTVISNGVLRAGTNGTMSSDSIVRVVGGSFDLNNTTNTVGGMVLYSATNTQAGGSLTTGLVGQPDNSLQLGANSTNSAEYILSGGSLSVLGNLQVGYLGTGLFTQTGGTNSVDSLYFVLGRFAGSKGTYDLSGGLARQGNAARNVIIGEDGEGEMTIGGSGELEAAGTIQLGLGNGRGTLRITNGGVVNAPGINLGTRIDNLLMFDIASAQTNFAVPISGAGSVVKAGTGTVVFDQDNSYRGTTTISNGALVVNGLHSGTGAYTVENSGILAGTGQISAPVTVLSGGTINPGVGGINEELIVGSLTVESGGILNVILGGGSTSHLLVKGDLNLGATSSVVFDVTSPLTASLYPFLDYSGTRTGAFDPASVVPGGYELIYDADDKVIFLLQSSGQYAVAPLFNGENAVITGGTLPFDVFVFNNATNSVTFTAASGLNTTGAVSPVTVASETSDNGSGLEWSGTTVGANQSGDFLVTFTPPTGPVQTTNVAVEVSVYDHASAQYVAGNTNLAFAPVHARNTNAIATTNSISVANAGGFRVNLGVRVEDNTNSAVLIDEVGGLAAGDATDITGLLEPSLVDSPGRFTNNVQLVSYDDSDLNGASVALTTNNIIVTGYIYTGQGEWNTPGGGDWANINQWQVPGGTPGLDGEYSVNDTALFGANGSGTVTNDGSVQMLSMAFSNASSYTIGGNGTITLTASGSNDAAITTLAGAHTISNAIEIGSDLILSNATGTLLTLAKPVDGPFGLTKEGEGTTTLSAANTYTGGTTVNDGQLNIAGTLINDADNALTINGGIVALAANDVFGRHFESIETPIVINEGGELRNSGNVYNALGTLSLNGGTLAATATQASGYSFSLKGPVTVTGTSTSTITGPGIALGADTVDSTTFDVADGATLLVTTGFTNGPAAAWTNVPAPPSSLIKDGLGEMIIAGSSSYTGDTIIESGKLTTRSNDSLGSSSEVKINGGTLGLENGLTITSLIWDSAGYVGMKDAVLDDVFLNITGNLALIGGGPHRFDLTGDFVGSNPTKLMAAPNMSAFDPSEFDVLGGLPGDYILSISNNTLWIVSDVLIVDGTMQASGTNNYGSARFIADSDPNLTLPTGSSVTVRTNIAMSNNSTVNVAGGVFGVTNPAYSTTVQSGSTLGGYGTINGAVNVSGTYAPGAGGSGTILTNNGALTFNTGGSFLWTLYANTNSLPGQNFSSITALGANKLTVPEDTEFQMFFTDVIDATNDFWDANELLTNTWTVMTGTDLAEGTAFRPVFAEGSVTNGFNPTTFFFRVTNNSLTLNYSPGLVVFPGPDEFLPGNNNYPWVIFEPNAELEVPVGVNVVIKTNVTISNNSTVLINGQFTSLAGQFAMQNGSSLGGNGTINGNLVSSGLISPGNSPGTLSIGGNFTQTAAGTFLLEAASTSNFDRLNVSGSAAVDGTLQAVGFGGNNLSPGDRYQFLTANGGISGDFDTISLPAGLRGSFLISGVNNSLGTLLIAPSTYTSMALTPNQFNAAAALDNFIGAGGDRGTVSAALDTLNASQYPAAFEQVMPSQYASLPSMAFNVANALNSAMFQQLWVIRVNGKGFNASGVNMAPMQAEMGGTDDMGVFAINPSKDTKWSSFVDGNGVFANASSTGSTQNYRSQSGGVSTGAAYSWNDAFATGVYVGYQGLQAEYDNGRTIDNAVRFGVFGTYDVGDFYFNGLVGGAYHGYTVNRNIDFGGLNRTATGRPGAGEFDLALGTGYDFDIGDFSWGPFTTMQYTYLGVQGFTETGAGALNLDVDPYNSSSLLYTLGAQAAYNWKISKDVIVTPTIFAGWQHEFLQDSYQINSSFNTGGPAAPFNYNTGTPARDNFYGGVGVTVGIGDAWQATATYSSFVGGQNQNSQNLYLGLGYKF